MKKIVWLLIAALCLQCMPINAFASEDVKSVEEAVEETTDENTVTGTCGKTTTWSLNEDTGVLTIEGTGAMDDYTPRNAPWYSYAKTIREVVIAEGVTTVGNNAFYNYNSSYSNLAKVTFSESVTSIGEYAFYKCDALTSVVFPEGIANIGKKAFCDCSGLTSITIANANATLGAYAFANCVNLSSATYADTITYDSTAFSNTPWAKLYGTCGDNVKWRIDGDTMTVYGSGDITSAPGMSSAIKHVVIGEGVTGISVDNAFAFESVETVEIADTVKSIGFGAFKNTSITEIEIPESVTTIDKYAFANTTKLTSLTIPSTVKSLGSYMLLESAVTELTLNCDVTYSTDIFYKCANLEKLVINAGAISYYPFYYSANTLKSLTIGAGVKAIGESAFKGMKALETVILENGAYTSIGDYAFSNCTSLKSISIPANVTEIGKYAFEECSSLEEVIFAEGLETIGAYAYTSCEALKEVEIPLSVTKIGTYAFNAYYLSGDGEKEDYTFGFYDGFTMYGYINTEAERYAYRTNGVTFRPLGGDISSCIITLSPSSYTYDGTAKTPEVTVKTQYGLVLTEGTMYTTPVYSDNVEIGTAKVTITGLTPYSGMATKEFTIKDGSSSGGSSGSGSTGEATITDEEMEAMYAELSETETFVVVLEKGAANEEELMILTELFIAYGYNEADVYAFLDNYGISYPGGETHEHSYTSTVTKKATTSANGVRTYTCKCGDTYTKAIAKISTVTASKLTYSGKNLTPTITVKDSAGNTISSSNYSVKYNTSTRKNVGTYKATVTFKGSTYSGSKTITFYIYPKATSSLKTTLYGYDDVEISWSKVTGAAGYYVYYKKASAADSSYTKLKTTTSLSYKKANLSDGVKYTFKVVAYFKNGSEKVPSVNEKTSSIYTLKKLSTPTVAKYSSGKVKVTWTNIEGETGYQISKSTKKSGTSIVATVATTTGKSKTISATKGKTYYYKVRAYKTVNGKKIYGPWSSVKSYKLS